MITFSSGRARSKEPVYDDPNQDAVFRALSGLSSDKPKLRYGTSHMMTPHPLAKKYKCLDLGTCGFGTFFSPAQHRTVVLLGGKHVSNSDYVKRSPTFHRFSRYTPVPVKRPERTYRTASLGAALAGEGGE